MTSSDAQFLEELRAVFDVEAAEHVQAIVTGLLALEEPASAAEQKERIAVVFRAAHSLKGAARAVGMAEVESQCHALEDLFAEWKRAGKVPTAASLDEAQRALSALSAAVGTRAAEKPAAPVRSAPSASVGGGPVSEETVRIGVGKLDLMLTLAEEMFAAKLAAAQRQEEIAELGRRLGLWQQELRAVESGSRGLRQALGPAAADTSTRAHDAALARLLDFGDWTADFVRSLEEHLGTLARGARRDRHAIGKLVDDLLEEAKQLVLLPFGSCAGPFPKLVRDLCQEQGKEATLVIRGEEVPVDKRVLEELKDPLVHLLRNAIDHGIESPAMRRAAGKPPRATITIAVTPLDGRKVEVSVTDDGAGIDVELVKESAVREGLLSREEAQALDAAAGRALVLHADVSSRQRITKLSGRGLGLAIVRERAEKLGGAVTVDSDPGRRTRFGIVVPAVRTTFRGVLVEVAERRFVVPTVHVERVAMVRAGDVRTVEGRETIAVDGRAVARVRLADVLELPEPGLGHETPASAPVVVLVAGDERVAFAVDAVLGEQDVLVKRFGRPLVRVRNVSGATVLASGDVVPILNGTDLLRAARRAGTPRRSAAAATPRTPATKAILVVEDSITSRLMIKHVLEAAGYRVQTAVDGMDAFTQLRAAQFDLVVSDVEMPRLNGFDLTARIRADERLAELPVVLVTALETREDRERGIDVGANAYLGKSGFDQDDLLDAVRRLT